MVPLFFYLLIQIWDSKIPTISIPEEIAILRESSASATILSGCLTDSSEECKEGSVLIYRLPDRTRDEGGRPLNADEALLDHFGQRAYQVVTTTIRQTTAGTCGPLDRSYRQALIYFVGIDWMIQYGELDPGFREQARVGMEALLKILAGMHSIIHHEKWIVDPRMGLR